MTTHTGATPINYGMFIMPFHDPAKPLGQCYDEDLELIVRAEELGFGEFWIGEHHTMKYENIVMPEIFIGRALGETSRIRLGPAPVCLNQHHPAHVASRIAFLDHLSKGRLNLCFGAGSVTAIGAAFGAMNTMYAQVSARTREIGTLRAIGFSRRSILASFVLEALLLCVAGGILGIFFTFLVFNLFLTKPTGTMNFRTFSEVLFNFRMTPPLIAGGIAFSLAMGLLGGFFPAFRAARLKITSALRAV